MPLPKAHRESALIEPRPARPLLRVRGLRKSFGRQLVLDGLDLELPEGRTTVVLGPSGCGKSVLLKHIVGLIRPDAGEIWLGEQRIDTIPERRMKEVRLRMGLLFQLSALFDSMTVTENLEFPLREHTSWDRARRAEAVDEALEMVDMAGTGHKLPAELSGGQRKRIALARAVILRPSLILYDEPTTGLDPIRAKGIDELVDRLKERLGVTSLVVTHDLVNARRIADRMVMMEGGRVVAEGTYEELRARSEIHVQRFFQSAEAPVGSDGGDRP